MTYESHLQENRHGLDLLTVTLRAATMAAENVGDLGTAWESVLQPIKDHIDKAHRATVAARMNLDISAASRSA